MIPRWTGTVAGRADPRGFFAEMTPLVFVPQARSRTSLRRFCRSSKRSTRTQTTTRARWLSSSRRSRRLTAKGRATSTAQNCAMFSKTSVSSTHGVTAQAHISYYRHIGGISPLYCSSLQYNLTLKTRTSLQSFVSKYTVCE